MTAIIDDTDAIGKALAKLKGEEPKAEKPVDYSHMVGDFVADYSPVSPGALAAAAPELDDLYANSSVV